MRKNEIRKDYILERYVVVSSKRALRFSEVDESKRERVVAYEGKCPFCSGNERMTPKEIFQYPKKNWKVRVIPNKYPILFMKRFENKSYGLLTSYTPYGAHEVVIETPDHLPFHRFGLDQLRLYLKTMIFRYKELMKKKETVYVTMFKNHGEDAGATIPHEHSQILASPVFPKQVSDEMAAAERYYEKEKRCPHCDFLALEMKKGSRVIYSNRSFVAFCPFASKWPYEVWVYPKRHFSDPRELKREEIDDLAKAMKFVVHAYSKIYEQPHYNILYHSFPKSDFWHFHLEFYPRTSKVFASSEFFELYVNEVDPETAARHLRR